MSGIEEALKAASDTRALRIGSGILGEVPGLFREQFPGQKAVVVADQTTYRVAGEQVHQALKAANLELADPVIFSDEGLYAEYTYVDVLVSSFKGHDAVPVAVGSGTINDLTKLSSHLTGRPYMCVATAASMDGYTAFGASITANGAKQTFECPAPRAVLADLDIICHAPPEMTAAGYADLFAKITAGADWILADTLGAEAIEPRAWSIVQDGLPNALSDPRGVAAGSTQAVSNLIEGLMLGGFAMQWAKSSRPASGAEHQFSNLWNMEHFRNNGEQVPHGFQVSVALLAITAFYGQLLQTSFDELDIEACCNAWPSPEESDAKALAVFAGTDFPLRGVEETRLKYIPKEKLAVQLQHLRDNWTEIRNRLEKQLIPFEEAKWRLKTVGAPVEPEEIGMTRSRLRDTFYRAYYVRRRFNILDLSMRTGYMDKWLNGIFGKGGIWEIADE